MPKMQAIPSNIPSEKGVGETPTVLQNLLEFNKLDKVTPLPIEG